MGDNSSIEWTDATWNPVRGCSRVSPGCGGPNHQGGCYAEKIAARFSGPGQPFEGFAERGAHGGRWTGKMALVDDMLTLPLRWRKPRRIFVNSMSDLFHENLPDEAIDKIFAVMALAPRHTYQVLTKRADRMRAYMSAPDVAKRVWVAANEIADDSERLYLAALAAAGGDWGGATPWPLPWIWLGVSVEDQERADERIPDLLATPAAIRFLSCEPLLGPLDLQYPIGVWPKGPPMCCSGADCGCMGQPIDPPLIYGINWIIAGGESGPRARPSHPDWFRSLRDQCHAAGVAFHFKQWGEWHPSSMHDSETCPYTSTHAIHVDGTREWRTLEAYIKAGSDGWAGVCKVGKKRAGAMLDGREWREFPT